MFDFIDKWGIEVDPIIEVKNNFPKKNSVLTQQMWEKIIQQKTKNKKCERK